MTRDEFVARRAAADDHLARAQGHADVGMAPGAKSEAAIALAISVGVIADLIFGLTSDGDSARLAVDLPLSTDSMGRLKVQPW